MSIAEDALAQAPGWTATDATFGARLALIRQRMGWGNIAKAAKECGVPTDSWRNWEVDGREPHRITTIAMTIASRTGCDYLWLVHGPNRGGAPLSIGKSDVRIVAVAGTPHPTRSSDVATTRPVRQTRPTDAVNRRPLTAMAL